MAIALSNIVRHNCGDLSTIHFTATYSSTYSNAATITAAQLGLTQIESVVGQSEGGYIFSPVLNAHPGSSFIPHLFTGATPTEASGTVAEVVNAIAYGR